MIITHFPFVVCNDGGFIIIIILILYLRKTSLQCFNGALYAPNYVQQLYGRIYDREFWLLIEL